MVLTDFSNFVVDLLCFGIVMIGDQVRVTFKEILLIKYIGYICTVNINIIDFVFITM